MSTLLRRPCPGPSYVKLPPLWTCEDWRKGIRMGRNYVGDGMSHLMEFQATQGDQRAQMGEAGSEFKLAVPGSVRFTARVAARLEAEASSEIKRRPISAKPCWDIERARIDGAREALVELIVDSQPVAQRTIVADGSTRHFSA